jgi:hypothetical protein
MANHGLRTAGRPNGNFGAARIQGKRDALDLSDTILNRDNLRIPQRDQAFTRLWEAYNIATDPKLKEFLAETLAKRQAAIQPPKVKPMQKPPAPYWDRIKAVR